jgi:ribonuclease HI
MKTLKLDHTLAEQVRSGEKTSTWRLYDDKDISVDDTIELLDKVNPSDPSTWVTVGMATVNEVIEKRLGDIDVSDTEGHSDYASREDMLKNFQKYYGTQVTFDTPIKLIHFTLDKKTAGVVKNSMPKLVEAKLYADGGSRGNPGPSASGFAIMNMDGQVVVKKGVYLGVTTNNQAEYQALKFGLEEARSMGIRQLHVYLDSLLVVNQMLGRFKVKNRDLWPIHDSVKQLVPAFGRVSFTHIPRELNKIADGAVNEALDEAAEAQIG